MTDRKRTYISSVMTAKKSGASPGKRRKYDEVFKAEALRLASGSRRPQAAAPRPPPPGRRPAAGHQPHAALPLAAGPARGRRGPRGRGARPRGPGLAGGQQAAGAGTGHFKKSLGLPDALSAFSASRPREHLPAHRPTPGPGPGPGTASTRPPALSNRSPATGPGKAGAGAPTPTPTPNRFGAASTPSSSTAAASPDWKKPSSKSATTRPTTMRRAATRPWTTVPPTTSKPVGKPRPNAARLS